MAFAPGQVVSMRGTNSPTYIVSYVSNDTGMVTCTDPISASANQTITVAAETLQYPNVQPSINIGMQTGSKLPYDPAFTTNTAGTVPSTTAPGITY